MARFIQLGNSYSAQEANWVKGGLLKYGPRKHVDSLEVIKKYMMIRNLSASDYSEPVADFDFYDFDYFVGWLPKRQQQVFIAEMLRYYVIPKTKMIKPIGCGRNPWAFISLSKHDYKRILDEAIANIKKQAGLV